MSQQQGPFRPDGITYWVDERPPLYMTIMVALQQLAFLGSIMTLPVLLARQAGLDDADAAGLVALTMVAAGCGVILQALNRGGIGIGLFSPMHTSAIAFPASIAAVKMGGAWFGFRHDDHCRPGPDGRLTAHHQAAPPCFPLRLPDSSF